MLQTYILSSALASLFILKSNQILWHTRGEFMTELRTFESINRQQPNKNEKTHHQQQQLQRKNIVYKPRKHTPKIYEIKTKS